MLLLLAGTAWGQDDHFPFGPFKMYSRATKTTGRITWPRLEGRDAAGRTRNVTAGDVGLRRAELEGQLPRMQHDPELLGALATAWRRVDSGRPPLVELRLLVRSQPIVDSTPVGEPTERLVVTWPR
ncbi:MAG TPA: hypothetical protein VHF47_02585 [Acidimicrobiales bacterium]|nr:hypothetical protein [Acidimicrobiales bacterium]